MHSAVIKYKSPFGIMTIGETGGAISRVYLPNAEPDVPESPSELLERARAQFAEYFGGKRKGFDLPLDFGASGNLPSGFTANC